MNPVLLFTHPDMQGHDPGPGHPEHPGRLLAIEQAIAGAELPGLLRPEVESAAVSQLQRVHRSELIDDLAGMQGRSAVIDADTRVSPGSVRAAFLAAGAAVQAVDAVMTGPVRRGFCLLRPPGHHAESNKMMGFCLLNNVAIAATHAIANYGLSRVLVVDWDVHHGNGTQEIFWRRKDVLYLSSHQFPLYPGTGAWQEQGESEGLGYSLNFPLPSGSSDEDIVPLYQRVLRTIEQIYAPELILVSAGFDAHAADPLAQLRMSSRGFADLTRLCLALARSTASGRILLMLEGGYDLAALSESVLACLQVLTDDELEISEHPLAGNSRALLQRARSEHRRFLPLDADL